MHEAGLLVNIAVALVVAFPGESFQLRMLHQHTAAAADKCRAARLIRRCIEVVVVEVNGELRRGDGQPARQQQLPGKWCT